MKVESYRETAGCARGMTLIEVMFVVVIMAILAAVILPSMTDSRDDAKQSVLQYNQSALQRQIDLYKLEHHGLTPKVVGQSLPQLLSPTDAGGAIGASGPDFPFGPYIQGGEIPVNPIVESNKVVAVADLSVTVLGGDAGWLYHEATGRIAPRLPIEE